MIKLNKICAAAVALCAAPAFALTFGNYTNTDETTGDTQNIRMSGATAVDPGIISSALRLCTTTSIHRYSISNNTVVFCTINPAQYVAPAGKTKLAFYKYSIGGSGGGVGNVNNGTNIPFVDLTKLGNAACTGTNASVTAVADLDGTNPLPTFVDTLCNGASSSLVTNFGSFIGVSDVEPQFFGPAVGNWTNLKAESLASVIFGVPVTKNVYEALQTAQGIAAVGSLLEADMPSLSQGQITSLYTQEGQSWSALTGAVLADDTVYVARRFTTSGTQKTFEALIGRTTNTSPGGRVCQSPVDGFVSGPNAADNTAANSLCNGANLIVNNSGSNQVVTCLNKHQADGRGAVGTLSTEYKTSVGGSIRFTKINGVAPTYRGVASGAYTQYSDLSLNTRLATANGHGPTALAPGYSNFLTRLKINFADPTIIEVVNGSNQPYGPSGLLALDALANPIPASDFTGATARNPWTRLVGGTDLNNSQPGKQASF